MTSKARLLVATILLLCSACATTKMPTTEEISRFDYGPYPQNYETLIKAHFKEILFDPYSAVYESIGVPSKAWWKDSAFLGGRLYTGYIVIVRINAKNRYGGYVGIKTHGFIINNDRIVRVLQDFELQNYRP